MSDLALLHGAGFRLILRPPVDAGDRTREADLFGSDGRLNKEPIQLAIGEREGRAALVIDETAVNRIAELLPATDAMSPRERLAVTPVRLYQRISAAMEPPDPALLERLGRLGDALLVDLDIGPQPGDMEGVPAAYTYLGQFIAHELTVWHPVGSKEPPVSPYPIDSAIDLKTIFLLPEGFPKNLPKHVKTHEGLPLGQTIADLGKGFPGAGLDDLPRGNLGVPLLFEPRNDQNLAISQTHVVITRFAQAALRRLDPHGNSGVDARRIVKRHVQWVLLQDYLTRLVDDCTLTDVMTNGRVWVAPTTKAVSLHPFYVPPEVSGAIFRFGHAMVRSVYKPWNTADADKTVGHATASDLLAFSFKGGALQDGRLIQSWTVDWRHLLEGDGVTLVRAQKLGTTLGRDLFCLPDYLFQPGDYDRPCSAGESGRMNLARRTLMAGALMQLPTGQSLVRQVNDALLAAGSHCAITPLTEAELHIPDNPQATAIMLEGKEGTRFVDQTPLWLYVLREAAVREGGNRLGPLAGRIVAETLSAAVEASGTGMIEHGRLNNFEPDPLLLPGGSHRTDRYDYADLVRLAFSA
jgi:hypothetical protein